MMKSFDSGYWPNEVKVSAKAYKEIVRMQTNALHSFADKLLLFEHVLAHAAYRAFESFRQVFKWNAGLQAIVGIAYRGIVDISANGADINIHVHYLRF